MGVAGTLSLGTLSAPSKGLGDGDREVAEVETLTVFVDSTARLGFDSCTVDVTYLVLSVVEREEEEDFEDVFVLPKRDEVFADDVREVLLLDVALAMLFVSIDALCLSLESDRAVLSGKRGVSLSS